MRPPSCGWPAFLICGLFHGLSSCRHKFRGMLRESGWPLSGGTPPPCSAGFWGASSTHNNRFLNLEPLRHLPNPVFGTVLFHVKVTDHFRFFAKKALAFFRNSFSSSRSFMRFFKARSSASSWWRLPLPYNQSFPLYILIYHSMENLLLFLINDTLLK